MVEDVDMEEGKLLLMKQIRAVFIGNPNCGKTTLFNAYTGARHKVGNWPGVTVEKKEGVIKHDGHQFTLVDLPGIYSLSPYSLEEILTREYILNYDPDVIINIVDASNLERNLYLTLQLIELGKPVIVALNMMDVIESKGRILDIDVLSSELGVPVIPVVAVKKKGLTRLLHQIIKSTKHYDEYIPIIINYGDEIEEEIYKISKIIEPNSVEDIFTRWTAIKILENDSEVVKKIEENNFKFEVNNHEEEITRRKYDYISCFLTRVIKDKEEYEETFSDKVDKIVTNELFGIPIFLMMMALVFTFTFTVGNYVADLFDIVFSSFSEMVLYNLEYLGVNEWLISLIVDGIIGGVAGILIFLPNIATLFIAISVLEDSGYMARVALIMDKFMRRIGLNGKAFIPMILGFGCSVPAIMTARTLEDERDRLITILIVPFMSCSARFPIYVLFSRAFFPGREILVAFSLYILGVIVAIIMAIIFKNTIGKGNKTSLIMELPEYKSPSLKTTGIFVYEKVKGYVQKAGTVIFLASIVLWFILEFNFTGKADMTNSLGADIGKFVAPIFRPIGFGNWQATLALIAGVMGKEIVVSSMTIIYGIGEAGLSTMLSSIGFTTASAYAFMVFTLLYTPCVAALGTVKKETNSWKWMFFSLFYQLIVAWIVSFLIYQFLSLWI